jgi:hypothetical protein
MEYSRVLIVSFVGLLVAWILFSKVIRAKTSTGHKIKVTLVVLLFASLIIQFSHDLYAYTLRSIFSFNQQGKIYLVDSPFKIPTNQDREYCKQFKDQHGNPIEKISTRDDGRYCGEFWRFKTKEHLEVPYKTLDENHLIYWASPDLQIVGPNLLKNAPINR